MTLLYLDGMLAIPTNANIKLTVENQYFTKSSTYSYDVELPLNIPENRAIFGRLGRLDQTKQARTLTARLIADNITILEGIANLRSISEKSVKVQLLGENAAYNYSNKMEETFIDMLNLGDWYRETFKDGKYYGLYRPEAGGSPISLVDLPEDVFTSGNTSGIISRWRYEGIDPLTKFYDGTLDWVAFPCVNSSADVRCNVLTYTETAEDSNQYAPVFREYDGERGGERTQEDGSPVYSFCVQPYVWLMCEKIAAATGFTLPRAQNYLYTHPFYKKIFIVNTNPLILCNRCLPHWSVNEWWTQIENTFGLVVTVDYLTKTMKLQSRGDFYRNADVVELRQVSDPFTVDVDDKTESDVSVNNVGFSSFDNNPEDVLSEYVIGTARVLKGFTNASALASAYTQNELSEMKDVIFDCDDGRRFIVVRDGAMGYKFAEVDMLRPRIVKSDDDDIDIELGFVPARFTYEKVKFYRAFNRHPGAVNKYSVGEFDAKMLMAPGPSDMGNPTDLDSDELDIEAIMSGEQDEGTLSKESEGDVISIAIAELSFCDSHRDDVAVGDSAVTGPFVYHRGWLRCRRMIDNGGNITTEDGNCSLSLIPIDGEINLASASLEGIKKIGTKEKHYFSFLSKPNLSPFAIFSIANKRYVCEKLELTITPDGVSDLISGYFYELEL